MTDEAKALVEECRLDAKAFRENTVYDSDGDPIRLIANADRLDQYADLIETQAREIEQLREALEQIKGYSEVNGMTRQRMKRIARAALKEIEGD